MCVLSTFLLCAGAVDGRARPPSALLAGKKTARVFSMDSWVFGRAPFPFPFPFAPPRPLVDGPGPCGTLTVLMNGDAPYALRSVGVKEGRAGGRFSFRARPRSSFCSSSNTSFSASIWFARVCWPSLKYER